MRDRRATARQREEAAVRAEMDQRRQASFVTGWGVSSTSEHYGPLSGIHRIGGPTLIHYKILNDSDGPVSDVVILIPPEQENSPRGNLSIGFLPPKSDRSTEQRSTETLDIEFSVPRAVPFFFTDTQGIRWFRDGQGGSSSGRTRSTPDCPAHWQSSLPGKPAEGSLAATRGRRAADCPQPRRRPLRGAAHEE